MLCVCHGLMNVKNLYETFMCVKCYEHGNDEELRDYL